MPLVPVIIVTTLITTVFPFLASIFMSKKAKEAKQEAERQKKAAALLEFNKARLHNDTMAAHGPAHSANQSLI